MRVSLSLPDELVVAMDVEGSRRHQTRSELVCSALREYLALAASNERSEAVAVLRRNFRGGRWNAEDLVRAERVRRL